MSITKDVTHRDYWACACVKRDTARKMTHIRVNHPSLQKCDQCGSERDMVFDANGRRVMGPSGRVH